MFTRLFHPARFLRSVSGTEPFHDYCLLRGIPLDHTQQTPDITCWAAALATLAQDEQARIELELAQVNEMAGREANAHLLEAANDAALPSDDIPAGASLALWFFVHRSALFQEVFFHHEIREARSWRIAKALPGIAIEDLPAKATALGEELRAFFRQDAGTGRFCAVEAHTLPDATFCFAARIADRIQLIEGFTEGGQPTLQRVRPALAVLFAYQPQDGSVMLKSPLRAKDRVRELYQCFGRAILGTSITARGVLFDLNRLKLPFHPLPDAEDMESVRLKALHLRYPERSGRRQLKLETLAGDAPTAIEELLHAHIGDSAHDLTVSHAELQVRLRIDGRPRTYPVRLWPDRSSLDRTDLGNRLRSCLKRWGLTDA